jgi:hypothetical protein
MAAEPRVGRVVVSGRDLFICDNLVDPAMVAAIGASVRGLHYIRKEKSRAGVPGLPPSSDLDPALLTRDAFFVRLRAIAERMFPGEAFQDLRAYANCAGYGEDYHAHRDSPEDSKNVTILYYANPIWERDWGGETIFYNDDNDAAMAVSPRPGRVVVSRGAILHRATGPTRSCYEERFTIVYQLSSGASAGA